VTKTFLSLLFTLHRISIVYIIQLCKICIAHVSSPSAIGIRLLKLATVGLGMIHMMNCKELLIF